MICLFELVHSNLTVSPLNKHCRWSTTEYTFGDVDGATGVQDLRSSRR